MDTIMLKFKCEYDSTEDTDIITLCIFKDGVSQELTDSIECDFVCTESIIAMINTLLKNANYKGE